MADQGAPRPTQGQLGIARPSRPSHPSREATGASRPEPKPERRQCWRRVTSFGPRRQECRRSRLLPMNLSPVRQAFLPAGSGGFPAPSWSGGLESPPNRQPGKAALRSLWSRGAIGEPLSLPMSRSEGTKRLPLNLPGLGPPDEDTGPTPCRPGLLTRRTRFMGSPHERPRSAPSHPRLTPKLASGAKG